MADKQKGAILFIVLAVILVVVILSGVILSIISSQTRLTNHQVTRIKAYYATKGMMNYAFEMLRNGTWVPNSIGGENKYACHRGCIDAITPDYTIATDSDIPFQVQITIFPGQSALNNTTTQLDIKTKYTYVP